MSDVVCQKVEPSPLVKHAHLLDAPGPHTALSNTLSTATRSPI